MFSGSIVALITPMNAQGNICRISLKKLIDYHIASSTAAIVSVGTTGESATLSYKEHGDVIMMALDLADGRIPIIAGTGANSTTEAICLTKRFSGTGIIGCLTVTPYYNCPTQEGIYQHFKSIAESTDLPQILYNVPSRTGCDMLPETIARLSEIKNIIGVKEATGDLSRISQIQALVDNDFILISGDDATALDSMQLGSKGVISVTANIAAREMVQICALAQKGKFTEARFLNRRLMYLHHALFYEPNPIPVKWAAKKLGLITENILRLPMIPLTEAGKAKMIEALIQAGLQEFMEY